MQSRHHPITVGLCAMDKKVKAKPMRELTKRMEVGGEFVFIEYGDDMILNQPISEWPVPDVLIAFFSDGFPLEKCIECEPPHFRTALGGIRMGRSRSPLHEC